MGLTEVRQAPGWADWTYWEVGAWMGLQKEDQTSEKGKGSLWENNNALNSTSYQVSGLGATPSSQGTPSLKVPGQWVTPFVGMC